MTEFSKPAPGKYRHYKGNDYEVLHVPVTARPKSYWWFTARFTETQACG